MNVGDFLEGSGPVLAMLDRFPTPLALYCPDGSLVFANQAARQCYDTTLLEAFWTERFVSTSAARQAESDLAERNEFALSARVRTKKGVRWHRLEGQFRNWKGAEANLLWLTEQDISSLKSAQAELQESNDRLQQVFPGFVSWVGADCRYLGVNQHLADLFNLTPDDFVGQEVGFNSTDPSFRQMLEAFFCSSAAFFQQEISIPVRGQLQHYLLLAQKSTQGDRAAIVGVDVSAQKAIQGELQVTVSRFEGLLANLRLGVTIVDECERVLLVNQAFCDLFGPQTGTPQDWIGRDFGAFVRQRGTYFADPQAFTRRHQEICKQHEGIYNEELQLADGRTWVQDCVPIWVDGQYRGYLWMFRDVSERVRFQQQLWHNAYHDALTGLPNRTYFLEKLQDALNTSQKPGTSPFIVLFVDLDRFKLVNDSLGHMAGDRLLVEVADRLRGCIRSSDLLARLGGDEFAILLPTVSHESDAALVADRIVHRLREPLTMRDREFAIGSSIGIAAGTQLYQHPEELLRDADLAMYRAKADGGSTYAWFDPQLQARALRRLELETDLRHAIENDQLCLHYQPIVNLADGTLVGFEALVRWSHPRKGWISPEEFVPIAEETRDIIPLGDWVFRAVCQQVRAWQANFPAAFPLTVNVNISAVQLRDADLPARFSQILQEADMVPDCLKLEITESVLMSETGNELSVLEALRSLGLEFCIDDFGMGYSSLSRLHALPVSTLKIDRAFVERLEVDATSERKVGQATLQTILALATGLKANTVAEGIETHAQCAQLLELGCKLGQGYLFARPLDPQAAAQLLYERSGTGYADGDCPHSRTSFQ